MPEADCGATANRLILAAEAEFARAGIQGASLRRINALAGQRNTSAVRYHFGSREGLLEALIERRMGELERERATALTALLEGYAKPSVEQWVGVLVSPLAERVCSDVAWARWIRVLAQLVSVRGESYQWVWRRRHDATSRAIFSELRGELISLSESVWRQRALDLVTWVTSSLCERAQRMESGSKPLLGRQAFTRNLIVTTSQALAAPKR